ncbi:MAG TPA: D-2-hydroxyacid dehydrogenase [Bryobacteraceae bacterium]|nr:D-2-hydroxyacid dehydrogenase [Bryobacteraceae bacterium]
MEIVVLDGYALNPGDLSWDWVEALGATKIYDRTEERLVVERAAGAEIVLTNKTPLSADTLRQLPQLRYIGVLATGYDIIDMEAAYEQGITVTNVPTYGTASVAQFTIAMLLELCHHIGCHSEAVRAGEWSRSQDWSFWKTPLVELSGKTMGIVGFGRIGRQTANIAHALGLRVIATDAAPQNAPEWPDFRWLSLEELLAESDVVSLHSPLFPETAGMINARTLARMKPSAFLINTSRGPLIVEEDLAAALNRGKLAGAALDVLSLEPPPPGNPLFGAKNCIITPHIAWATKEARVHLIAIAAENLEAFLRGTPQNTVNPGN